MDRMVIPLEDLPAIGGDPGEEAVPLMAAPATIAGRLPDLGPVRVRLFSGGLRHTVTGSLAEMHREGDRVCLRGEGVDLRLDPGHWLGACALTRKNGPARREGVRFVGPEPDSGLIVDLTPASSRSAFANLVAGDATPPGGPDLGNCPDRPAATDRQLLSRVEADLVGELLETVADAAVPVRLETGIPGARQGFTGIIANPVHRVGTLWVQGAGFRLELPRARVASARVCVQRMTEGRAHSVELLDAAGGCLLRLSGQPVAGRPEDRAWGTLVRALTSAALAS
jgi:putative hemin transport protein